MERLTITEKVDLENEAMELISQQVSEGYYSGSFDLEDVHGNYHAITWSINIEIDFD